MTDHQELVLASFVGPAVLAAAVVLLNKVVPDKLRSSWRTAAVGLLLAAAGFCLAVNVSNRAGTAMGALGALVGLIGMFIIPEDK